MRISGQAGGTFLMALKAEDPKALADIDAVFVTVEPHGGSPRPTGKQLLFAYLRIGPNHP